MKITTTMLGEIDVAENNIIKMPAGMIGFPDLHRYALAQFPDPEVPFLCWQCLDDSSLGFLLIDPTLIFPDYEVAMPVEEFQEIELKSAAEGSVYAVVTIPEDPREMTANLMGPVVINQSARKAKQIVLANPRYTTKHRVLQPETPDHACANSEAE